MISPSEITQKSVEFGINTSDVQRDYVFGWLISGLYQESVLGERLTLKGGNALRKAYLPATRFSEDIDLSATDSISEDWLLENLNEVCRFAGEKSGVQFDLARNRLASVDSIDRARTVYRTRLYFRDFSGNADHITISVRLDVTDFDRLILPVQTRQLIHQYSDATECQATVRCVALEEALADKLKCLLQRRYAFDLFDLVYGVFLEHSLDVDRRLIVNTFLRKTIFEPSPPAALRLLLGVPFEAMRSFWDRLICPAVSRMPFDAAVSLLRDGLHTLFAPFSYGSGMTQAFFPPELRNPILQAGGDLTLLRLTYDGVTRMVEPYSLVFKRRKDGVAQEYLYVYDRTGGRDSGPGVKSLMWHRINDLQVTEEKFEPSRQVELAKAGDRDKIGDFVAQSIAGASRRGVLRRKPVFHRAHVVRCPACGRQFRRETSAVRLRMHKDGYGNICPGRIGQRVR